MKAMPDVVRGTPVNTKELARGKVFTASYTPKLRYRWDEGEAIGRYLEEFREGRLIARSCGQCARVMIPPRMFCERCFHSTDQWVYTAHRPAWGFYMSLKRSRREKFESGWPSGPFGSLNPRESAASPTSLIGSRLESEE
ncbi:MAG: hypothetical protein HYU46_20245 [Deltaproteobacteria bacterium]|nr:hypothetical protein [Deltaproteobacteria bacterium]